MAHRNWGNCKNCRHFSSRSASPGDSERANCKQPQLQNYDLLVSGASGCNAFELRAGRGEEIGEQAPA